MSESVESLNKKQKLSEDSVKGLKCQHCHLRLVRLDFKLSAAKEKGQRKAFCFHFEVAFNFFFFPFMWVLELISCQTS